MQFWERIQIDSEDTKKAYNIENDTRPLSQRLKQKEHQAITDFNLNTIG